MRKLYLKQNIVGTKDKFTFYDAEQQEIYQGQQTSMSLPKRFGLVDCTDNKQVVELVASIFSMMPEFKLIDLATKAEFGRIKKQFTLEKGKVRITTSQGKYIIDGDFLIRDFKILDQQQREIISIHPVQVSWGEVSEVRINTDLIVEHIAVGLILGIYCAHYSDNRY